MADDLIQRAERLLEPDPYHAGRVAHVLRQGRDTALAALVPELLAALKAERAENEQLREDADRNAAMYRRAAAMYRRLGDG